MTIYIKKPPVNIERFFKGQFGDDATSFTVEHRQSVGQKLTGLRIYIHMLLTA